MSADSQILGIGTVSGAGAGAITELANTGGNPLFIGLIVSASVVILLGLITRSLRQR